jgi:hypothetical protein
MANVIRCAVLMFGVLFFRAAIAQETCSPIRPDGRPCVETTENRETQPGVWHWSFHNSCDSSLAMEFERGNGSHSGEFDIPANGDAPWYCSDNCGGVVHHDAHCYGGGQPRRTISTPHPLGSVSRPTSVPAPTATPTSPPAPAPIEPAKPTPIRAFSELACAESGNSCHASCQQSFGNKGNANFDGLLACNQSCTSQLSACMQTGNALVNSEAAISAGRAIAPKSSDQTRKKSEAGTTHLREPGGGKKSTEGSARPRSVGAVAKHAGYVLGHDPNTCGRRYGAPFFLCAPNCTPDQKRRSQLAVACTQRE